MILEKKIRHEFSDSQESQRKSDALLSTLLRHIENSHKEINDPDTVLPVGWLLVDKKVEKSRQIDRVNKTDDDEALYLLAATIEVILTYIKGTGSGGASSSTEMTALRAVAGSTPRK